MKLRRNVVVLTACLLPLIAGAVVDDFSSIPKRNAFGLGLSKPRKPPEIKPDLPQVSLQGVTTLLEVRQALLKIQSEDKLNTTELNCILSEGQARDGVKVLRIDMETGTVWLTNQGNEQIFSLKRGP